MSKINFRVFIDLVAASGSPARQDLPWLVGRPGSSYWPWVGVRLCDTGRKGEVAQFISIHDHLLSCRASRAPSWKGWKLIQTVFQCRGKWGAFGGGSTLERNPTLCTSLWLVTSLPSDDVVTQICLSIREILFSGVLSRSTAERNSGTQSLKIHI